MIYVLILFWLGSCYMFIAFHTEDSDFCFGLGMFAILISVLFLIFIVLADSSKQISNTPVEWVAEENAFKEVEVSNTILKTYEHKNIWTLNKSDYYIYSVIEKGEVIISFEPYEKVIEYYNPTTKNKLLIEN